VNFVAHAAVSSVAGLTPTATFASMAPDLVGLVGQPPPELGPDGTLGLLAHRITDRHFHQHPTFLGWQHQLRRQLPNVDHPTSAALHVAIELCIDGCVLKHDRHNHAYRECLQTVRNTLPSAWTGVVNALIDLNDPTMHYTNTFAIAQRSATLVTNRLNKPVNPDHIEQALCTITDDIAETCESLISELAANLIGYLPKSLP
jgi:hypothetical protein